jgi:multiple sugar transport system substrate-binding protein
MRRDVRRREFILTAAGLGAAVGLAACGKSGTSTTPGASAPASSGEITGEVKVTFQQFGNSKVQANFLNGWAKKFTAAHPQATVKLQPIVASENDYYTKLQLSMRSPRTAPDMCYEDTFLINSDISAGYLTALDDRISSWPDWSQRRRQGRWGLCHR